MYSQHTSTSQITFVPLSLEAQLQLHRRLARSARLSRHLPALAVLKPLPNLGRNPCMAVDQKQMNHAYMDNQENTRSDQETAQACEQEHNEQ